jgi:hypothetical protein
MDKKIIAATAMALFLIGCAAGTPQGASDTSQVPYSSVAGIAPTAVGTSDLVFDPAVPETLGLPDRRDLPMPASLKKKEINRQYTGIIKNKTRYDVSVPSENSGATLTIPAHSWIEFTTWARKVDVTVYHAGKPFYCLKLFAQPKNYQFMCSKYDFVAEIVKPEPVQKSKPVKKKRRLKKRPKGGEGVSGLG